MNTNLVTVTGRTFTARHSPERDPRREPVTIRYIPITADRYPAYEPRTDRAIIPAASTKWFPIGEW